MKPKRLVALSTRFAAALLLLVPLFSTPAQTSDVRWEKVAPADEEFTALMPGKPSVSTEKEPYGQVTITSTYYTVNSADGPLFMIASVSGMQSFLALADRKAVMTSAADGFRESFLKEVRAKGLRAEMTFERDLTLNGHLGKSYTVVMGEISGLARLYSTRKKLYALLVLNALKDDKRIEQFINSFTLKEATASVGAVTGPVIVAATAPPPRPLPKTPIRGGVLNGKALSLPKPSYPEVARAAKASGTVTVQITIDEQGEVMSASAVSGHPLLHEAAVEAAYRAKFSPTRLSGQPVKVSGVVTYNFVLK